MHRRHHLQGLIALPALALAQPGRAQAPGAEAARAAPAEPVAAELDRRLRERLLVDAVGFAAVQVGPGGTTLHTVGVRRQGEPAPVTDRTLFELGSLTKPFVALAFADGLLAGRWAPDDAVEDALPGGLRLRDSAGRPLRLIDLATHRSGLPRMPGNLAPREMESPYVGYTETRLFEFLRGWQADAPRDTRFEYSNLGYGLLAQVLARREGRTLDALLADRVLRPLGLDDIGLQRPLDGGSDGTDVAALLQGALSRADRLAQGHDGRRRAVPGWSFDAMAGAVGLIGSIRPVGRFLQAALGLYDHPLQPAFRLCLQPRGEGEHPLHPFGLAWELSPLPAAGGPRWLANQDGATGGYSTSTWLDPARRRGAAVLANSFVETRGLALAGIDPGLREQDFGWLTLPPEALRALAGTYGLADGYALRIGERSGRLYAQARGQAPFELVPRSARRFVVRDSALELEFDGEPPRVLTVRQGDRSTRFERRAGS